MSKSSAARWVKFFNTAGIPSPAAANYAHIFVENRIQDDMLLDLNKEYLREMGITPMGDIIAILRHAKQVSEQYARDQLMIQDAPTPVAKVVATPVASKPQSSPAATETSNARKSAKIAAPTKPARRVLPEHEGKYKVTLPLGTTERSKQILAKRDQLYSDRVSTSKKSDIFSRLQKGDADDSAQEGIVSSSGETRARTAQMALANRVKTMSISSSSSVFARLGGKQTNADAKAKEIKSILKNTQRSTGAIVKAKSIATPAVQQKVMLVHKVPIKRGSDDSGDESIDDDVYSEHESDASSTEEHSDLDIDMHAPQATEKIVKFASTAEVREIASDTHFKARGKKNFANNIKSRLSMVSKLHATRKTYNMKPNSPTKRPLARTSPVKGKTIRMRSDELLTRQELPVHKRLGGNAPPTKFGMRRNNSVNISHNKSRAQSGSVFERLGSL